MANIWTSPFATGKSWQPDDLLFEHYADTTDGSGDSSLTLLTDTTFINNVLWMYPVTQDTSAAATSISKAAPSYDIVGTAPAFIGEASKVHNVYMIGGVVGRGIGARAFKFSELGARGSRDAPGVVWEIVTKTLSGGTATITYATDCEVIRRGLFALPVHIIAAAPTACGVSAMTTTTAVLRGGTTETLRVLVGGLPEPVTVGSGSYVIGRHPVLLESVRGHQYGDLIGEVISKTLDGASPSKVTITASSDCTYIRHIETVLPMATMATAQAVGWAGTRGATSVIYSANASVNLVLCLVLGR